MIWRRTRPIHSSPPNDASSTSARRSIRRDNSGSDWGARPILVLTGKGASQQAKVLAEIPATAVYANLAEATAGLLLEETP